MNSRAGAAWSLLLWAAALVAVPSGVRAEELTQKESFMLMFGKGNGAMRLLCALQKQGVIDRAIRKQWAAKLDSVLTETADTADDRRNTRIGMAFAERRRDLCHGEPLPRIE